eukprot:6180372-Pleurochrysis_carterae.AAC.2
MSLQLYSSCDCYKPPTRAYLHMLRASDALKVVPLGPFWHLAAPERAAAEGSGAGYHWVARRSP